MTNQEIAVDIIKKFVAKGTESVALYENVKKSIWDYLVSVGSLMNETIGGIETEKQFLDVVCEIVDAEVNFQAIIKNEALGQAAEIVDIIVFQQLMYALDKQVIDKMFGETWFTQLKSIIANVAPKTPVIEEAKI